MPVDQYIGGAEHAINAPHVRPVLRSRRFADIGARSTCDEPFQALFTQGMIQGPDGHKMSKSQGNVISPMPIVERFRR